MKIGHFSALTAAILLAAPMSGMALDATPPAPVAVAESETFEVVGRLADEGFVFFIDRADSNAPVLGATLEVETGGKAARAAFRTERGDYLIADAEWLKPLRQPGEYPLALTVIAGAESDLLTADFDVFPASTATGVGAGFGRAAWVLAGLGVLGGGLLLRRWRKGGSA
ncbi:MAG: hypothetical protein KA535_08800 [Azonexus sp.]|nr:hypothetical protein [Azonexus sp.]